MTAKGFQPDARTASVVFDLLADDQLGKPAKQCLQNFLHKALSLFHRIHKQGFHPNLVTFGTFVKALYRRGTNNAAHSLLRNMEFGRLFRTRQTIRDPLAFFPDEEQRYFTQHCHLLFLIQEANYVPKLIMDKGCGSRHHHLCFLLDCYWLRGQLDEVSKLMDLIVRKGCQPNIVYLNAMAITTFKEMEKKGLIPNIVVDGLCEAGGLKDAADTFS
ncbi:hypothetical protein Cgig2_012952 [Carnegiea gigantea]|uniref:Pentatricopeptide repeat-containing protein n=1 Tax=Carnegiea gigantea TaxID=171969 RepID=A0A9Q1GMY6_9CARY|nr:hypothetical protein Cgig2_012952 [Carnegiea gigantea]